MQAKPLDNAKAKNRYFRTIYSMIARVMTYQQCIAHDGTHEVNHLGHNVEPIRARNLYVSPWSTREVTSINVDLLQTECIHSSKNAIQRTKHRDESHEKVNEWRPRFPVN